MSQCYECKNQNHVDCVRTKKNSKKNCDCDCIKDKYYLQNGKKEVKF